MFTSRNVKRKLSIERKRTFIVTHAFESLITCLKLFYNLIIFFKMNFLTFLVKTDYIQMFVSRNVKRKPSIDKKSPFIVTHAFESLIIHFKWFYNLIIDFMLNFLTFLVKTHYNWMLTSRNMKQKPSIEKKRPFIVTHAFETLIAHLIWIYDLIINFKLNFFTFFVKTDYKLMFT